LKEIPFEQIASMYEPLIKSFIGRYNLSAQFDQYYQAGLIGLWKAYKTFNPEKGQFSSYAHLLVRGGILQELRKEIKTKEREDIQDHSQSYTFQSLYRTDTIPLIEDEALNLYLIHLTKNQKRWVISRIVEMKSETEIAEDFGVTIYAVKSWRKAALKKLRNIL
jgi:RNA polymerase sigma factor (sigma-70 family)